jgi:AcrR family transcriptional regulator
MGGSRRNSGANAPVRVAAPQRGTGATRIARGGGRLPRRLGPRKQPLQDRSRATVEAILRAAAELFAARGYARTNTNVVARRAGVSVGSLYQYFPNKDAILAGLLDRHLDLVDAVIQRGMTGLDNPAMPLRTAIRRMLGELRAMHDADPGLTHAVEALVGQVPRLPDAFRERVAAHVRRLAQILERRPDVRRGNRSLMAELLFQIAEAASGWVAHRTNTEEQQTAALDEATEAICRYVEAAPG